MTPDELAAIRARVDKATSGPWVQGYWNGQCTIASHGRIQHPGPPECHYNYKLTTGGLWDEMVSLGDKPGEMLINSCHEYCKHRPEDAAFIAAARSDIPALLGYVEMLQDALEEALRYQTGECDYACGHPTCKGRQDARALMATFYGNAPTSEQMDRE